jgi:6-phosphofructokinase
MSQNPLKGNLIFGQSGGPTSVINASAAGVFIEALGHGDIIEHVYGAAHGIVGILGEEFYDLAKENHALFRAWFLPLQTGKA